MLENLQELLSQENRRLLHDWLCDIPTLTTAERLYSPVDVTLGEVLSWQMHIFEDALLKAKTGIFFLQDNH